MKSDYVFKKMLKYLKPDKGYIYFDKNVDFRINLHDI